MDSFWRLNGERQIGMGVGPIPFSAIDRYAQRYGITDLDRFDRFLLIIKALDSEYLRISAPKSDDAPDLEVSIDDVEGTRSLLRRLSKRTEPDPPDPPAEPPPRKSRTRKR
jgi:hypothetical protein